MIFSKDFSLIDYWKNEIDYSWIDTFQQLWLGKAMQALLEKIDIERTTCDVYPLSYNTFRAFRDCSYDNTKIIMLGVAPSHLEFNKIPISNGLLFDEGNIRKESESRTSKQWNMIYNEYDRKYPEGFPVHMFDGSVEKFTKEGILMLNVSLTVRAGQERSHEELWKPFMIGFLKRIMKSKPIHIISFGKIAKSVLDTIKYPEEFRDDIMHPGASAVIGQEWKPYGSKNFFERLNELLDKEVEW